MIGGKPRRWNSGANVREISKLVGGGGGGKPGIAQGGGTDAGRIEEALERGWRW